MWVSSLVIRGILSSFIEGAVDQNALRFLLKAFSFTLGTSGALQTDGALTVLPWRPHGVINALP